jgi:hypothetical protein
MTNPDREAFARLMYALGDTFNEPVSELRAEAYFDALRDLSVEDVLAAGRRAIAECRFFPRPVELRDMVHGSGTDQAEVAWNHLRQLVRRVGYVGIDGRGTPPEFPDDAMRRAAYELYGGGWKALCERLPSEGPELFAARKAFIAGYTAYANHDRQADALLPAHVAGALTDGTDD